jgi:hypothetical protein
MRSGQSVEQPRTSPLHHLYELLQFGSDCIPEQLGTQLSIPDWSKHISDYFIKSFI